MVESCWWTNLFFRKAGSFRRGVGIERRSLDIAAAGPEARAAHFVRVGFASDWVCPWTLGSPPAREASHTEIETSPEEVHRTDFAKKSGAEFLEYLIDPNQDAPEFIYRLRIVGGMNLVPLERNGIGNLAGRRPDLHVHAEIGKGRHELLVELGDTF